MDTRSLRRAAIVVAVFALGAGAGACGNRENLRGNPGQGRQSSGVSVGTNPADAAQTSTTNTSTLGSSIVPAERGTSKGGQATPP